MLIGEWVTTGKEFTRNERSEKKTVGKSKDNFNEKIKKILSMKVTKSGCWVLLLLLLCVFCFVFLNTWFHWSFVYVYNFALLHGLAHKPVVLHIFVTVPI